MAAEFCEISLSNEYKGTVQGGPEFSTTIVKNPATGAEKRNVNRPDSQWRGVIDTSALTVAQIEKLFNLFEALKGRGVGCRIEPPYGFNKTKEVFAAPGGSQAPDGVNKIFKLYMTSVADTFQTPKRIIKPVAGTLYDMDGNLRDTSDFKIYIKPSGGADTLQAGSAYSIDNTTGIITFVVAPPAGSTLKWSGRADLPVNFESDWFNPNIRPAEVGSVSGIPFKEILPATLGIAY